MRAWAAHGYSRHVIDLSFFVGIALGAIVTGFCAIGAFDRGFDSARRKSWSAEYAKRKQALVVASARSHAEVREPDTLVA